MTKTAIVTFSCLMLSAQAAAGTAAAPELRFGLTEGTIRNEIYRDGPIAAHLLLKSGDNPRLLVAFPAGNSGVGLWFDKIAAPVSWRVVDKIAPVAVKLADGGIRRGIRFDAEASTMTLTVKRALVSNVRVLRDYGYNNPISPKVEATPRISGNRVTWERRRIDGEAGYVLSVELPNGKITGGGTERLRFVAHKGRKLRLRVTALTGDAALTPIPEQEIFAACAAPDTKLRKTLAFLTYDEKMLAGSWRFNTYFGRDTLMSVKLLMPALKPRVIEAGLGAVFERLGADGEVAHEEDIAEYALLVHDRGGTPSSAGPILDYKMIDDDFMLAPVVASYLLDTPEGRTRAPQFLNRKNAAGVSYGELLNRNLAYVAAQALPFARTQHYRDMIALRPGSNVGEWRDSEDGLGGDGRYPYNINGVLVPAALEAAERLKTSGLLPPSSGDLGDLSATVQIWEREAPKLFEVSVTADDANDRIARFARARGVPHAGQMTKTVRFHALALDGKGQPIPVMHSDEGFLMLFGKPDARQLDTALRGIMQPYPSGLITPAGMLVANSALATPDRHAKFDKTRYHGEVVWSWQQGMMAAGLARQLARSDLSPESRELLTSAQKTLARAIGMTQGIRSSELWSWTYEGSRYSVSPFGQNVGDETESNALQLWSTIGLAAPCS